jgi:hypothetical protein
MQSTRTTTGRVVIVSAGIGAGHDGAATEIGRQLRETGVVAEHFDFLDPLPVGWGRTIQRTYARQLVS